MRPLTPTKLPNFRTFCQHRFHLAHKAATVRDKRGEVDIPPSTVFSAVFLMGAMGWGRCFHVTECFGLRLANGGFDSKHPPSVIPLWPEVCIKCSRFNSIKTCSALTTWALLTVAANPSCVAANGVLASLMGMAWGDCWSR